MFIMEFDNYDIFEDGRVFSHKTQKYLRPQNNGNGYLKVYLYKEGKMFQQYIHKLVAITFIPNPHNYKYIDHIDRNKANNNLSNLHWCSASENINNTAGKARYSVRRTRAKHYTNELKQNVRKDYSEGLTVMQLHVKYKIPRQSISRFVKEIRDIK